MLVSLPEIKKATLIAATIKMAFFSEYCYSICNPFILAFFGEKNNMSICSKKSISEELKLNDK